MDLTGTGRIKQLVSELQQFSDPVANRIRFDEIKAEALRIGEEEIPDCLCVEQIRTIDPEPLGPYFPETAITIRQNSWEAAVTNLVAAIEQLVVELRKRAILVTIDDLIAVIHGGLENQFFEFKSTLRWDPAIGKVNAELEFVVLKTIAAFSNSEGGNLLIGVDNAGKVAGLDGDFATFKNGDGNRDDFELHLRGLIDRAFGMSYSLERLDWHFPRIDGKDLCQIYVKPGQRPLFLEKKTGNGEKKEIFFFRSGNQSKPIEKLSEFFEYVIKRSFESK